MSIHSSTCTQRPPVANFTRQETWPPCWTGASQNPQPTTGPLPWLPGVPQALHDHPVWGHYLAKRSQLVTDVADQVEVRPDKTTPSLDGRRRAAARTSPSSVKSPCGEPPTASTPATHDPPEQHSCPQLRPSGNTTSTEVSPAAVTTTSVVLTSQSGSLLEPRVIAGAEIDGDWPNHPRSTRTRHPAPAYKTPR